MILAGAAGIPYHRGVPGTVYFDLETQRSFGDVGGAAHKDKMGMSVGVTYSTETGQYQIFDEENVADLVEQLVKADLVVGFNHIQFDYPVLQAYTVLDLASQSVNCDMMLDLEKVLGHRLKLDAVAQASLKASKTADGLDALKWWQLYKKSGDPEHLLNIAEYCCYDVKVTKEVYEYGLEHGVVKYADRNGHELEVEATWKKD
mgnify:CR=1 FL=1